MKRGQAGVKKKKERKKRKEKQGKNEGPNLFPTKTNIPLGLENQTSHSQKDLHQPSKMNPNNNQNTWGGRIKKFEEGKKKNTVAQFGFKYAHDWGKRVQLRKCQREGERSK